MNGGFTSHLHPFLSNVSSASLTRVSWINTKLGIVFKHGGLGDGSRSSCTSCARWGPTTTIASNGNKICLGERIWKKFCKQIKIWQLLRGITLWTIWIERNDKAFNHKQWHEPKIEHCIWTELILYAMVPWKRVTKQINISSFSTMALLEGFDNMWGARNVLCRRNNLLIKRNWKQQFR